MNELLKINYDSDRPTVSGRDLHRALEVETPYRLWFPRMAEYGFSEDIDYTPYIFVHPQNKQEAGDHQLTIPMAKEIAMIQRTEKGKQVRQYFIQVEESWNSPDMILARANKIQARMLESISTKVLHLEAENATLKPKAEFFDAVADSKDAISIQEVAKVLNIPDMGQNNLFRWLRGHKILMQNNLPYQEYIDRKYFTVIEQSYENRRGEPMISFKTLVYQRGVDYIRRRLEEEFRATQGDYHIERGDIPNILSQPDGIYQEFHR